MPFFSIRPQSTFSVRSRRIIPLTFLTRQIITTGYVAAGYKDNVAWRNVNKNNHATDVCTNLGDLLQEAANYTSGAHNRDNAFLWGTNGTGTGGVGVFTSTSCFNMRNDTTLTKTSQMNTAQTVGDSATVQQYDNNGTGIYSWQNGNQAATNYQKFNLTTQQAAGTVATSLTQGGTGAGAHFSELFGYFWGDDAASGNKRKFVYATETESTPAANIGHHGQQKGITTKVGKGYAGNEGSYGEGNNFRITNYATETVSGTVAKPIANHGEENFVCGQDWGYALGIYENPGAGQTNGSYRVNYTTNVGTVLGASGQPGGTASGTGATGTCCPSGLIGGRSSGHCYWRD
jgi:hypothetical protein